MPSDFAFDDDDLTAESRIPPPKKFQPIVERLPDEDPPRAEAVEDDNLPLRDGADSYELPARSAPGPSRPERQPKDSRRSGDAGKKRRKALPLLLGASALLVLGTALTLFLVMRSKDPPDPKDKNKGDKAVAPSPPSPPSPQPKKEARDPGELDDDVLSKLRQSTVLVCQWKYEKVLFAYRSWILAGLGSGFIVEDKSKSRLIITNCHVVDRTNPNVHEEKRISLIFNNGLKEEFTVWGEIEDGDVDVDSDLAVVHPILNVFEPHPIPTPLQVVKNPNLKESQRLWPCGFPQGTEPGEKVSIGSASVIRSQTYKNGKIKEIKCGVAGATFGNSGGPLVDSKGEVVGVAVSGQGSFMNAIPSDRVLELLDNRLTGSKVSEADAQKLVDFHNQVRNEVHAGPVKWSKTLARYAQRWADYLAEEGELEHRPQRIDERLWFGDWAQWYGENLANSTSALRGVEDWYSEKRNYKPGTTIPKETKEFDTANYTQMVCKDTTEIGVGVADIKNGPNKGRRLIVCNYNPRGNIPGKMPYEPAKE